MMMSELQYYCVAVIECSGISSGSEAGLSVGTSMALLIIIIIIMHSSRMRTAHSSSCHWGSASVHAGIHPHVPGDSSSGVGLEMPQVWTWRPPGCGPGDPPAVALKSPQVRPLNSPPLVLGLEIPLARPLKLPPPDVALETYKAYWDTPPGDLQGLLWYHLQGMLGYTPPMNRMTDRHV